jgi:2'-5' RNA ligase/preprotein translocase subunit YajC
VPVSAQQKQQLLDRAAQLQARGTAALAEAPAPLRRALSGTQVNFRSEMGPVSAVAGLKGTGGQILAGVTPHDPRTINVVDQSAFNTNAPQLVAHEGTHLWANNLPPALQAKIPADNTDNPYNYGGAAGLNALRKKGGTMLDLPREQQAALVQYYQSQGGPKAPADVRASHEPFINDMNSIPQSVIQPTAPTDSAINTTPRAPLPPADALGVMQPATKIYPEKKDEKKKVDLSAGMVKKAAAHHAEDISKHPAGKVTAIDEESGLPIVRRHKPGEKSEEKPAAKPHAASHSAPSNEVAKPEVNAAKSAAEKPEHTTKYEFGSTQANIPESSDAHKAITAMQKAIPKEHLIPGKGEAEEADKPHVTVRYGIQGDDSAGIKKYLGAQKPFEAKLGKTNVFPQSKSSDGGAVVHAEVHSPDLHRMNSEIAKHGKFKESDLPDYKPHVTVAYVKPEVADKYKNMAGAEGKSFKVTHVAVSDKNGNHEEVALGGKQDAAGAKPEEKGKKSGTGFGALNLTKGQTVHLNSGIHGSIQHVNSSMRIVRIKTHDGHNLTVRHSQIAAVEDGKNDRNSRPESAATA